MGGAKAHVDVVELEEGLAEFGEHPFQLAQMRLLIDEKALDLVEHGGVRLVAVAAKGPARRNDANGRLSRQHGAYLDGTRMGAQKHARAVRLRIEIERVVLLAGGVLRRHVQSAEIVKIIF